MLLALVVSSSAWANDAGSEARFNELDRNGDGFVSRDEYAALEREAAEKQAKDGPATRRSSAAGGSKPKEPRTLTGEK